MDYDVIMIVVILLKCFRTVTFRTVTE